MFFEVYVPMLSNQIKITFFNSFDNSENFELQSWNITVNQLDCQTSHSRADTDVELNVSSVKTTKHTLAEWIAPTGCLQYFTQPTGRVESFNFNSFQGSKLFNSLNKF